MVSPDVEPISWARTILAFVVVAALLGLFGLALKYIRTRGFAMSGLAPRSGERRLQLVETLALDARRRLVIIRRDESEHLLLLGINEDIVVETNLDKSPALLQTKG